jgi:hypothetical protein
VGGRRWCVCLGRSDDGSVTELNLEDVTEKGKIQKLLEEALHAENEIR